METPSVKGARSQAAILAALVNAGKSVLLPSGAHHRYDFVLDEGNGRFTRVQCKSGVYRHGCVYFRTASADRRRPVGDPYFGQIDAFAVFCAELETGYLIPIEDVSSGMKSRPRRIQPVATTISSISQNRRANG